MGEWRETTLGQVIELKRGYDLPTAQRREGPVPIISSSGPSGFHNEAKAHAPGVVTGRYGTVGQVFYVDRDFWPLNTSLYVRDFKGNHPRFIYYFLKTIAWIGYNDKSGVPGINRNDVHRELIIFPDQYEQEKIAAILGALDDKIELNRRKNETLETMARAIFTDWFVDFGPTRAKMEGRGPYLAAKLWALFPDRLDDATGLPEGWEVGSLGRLACTNSDSWTARNHPEIVEYVDLSNTKWGNIENVTPFAWDDAPSRARRIARPGDTIVGTTRPGNGSFAYISREGLTVSTGFAVLSPRETIYRDIVYVSATRPENINRLANLADGHGGAYPAVNPNEVTDTELPLPGDQILLAFADQVSPLRQNIERSKEENLSLAQARELLLPKLMSGAIRLRDAEKIAGESL